MFDSKAMIITLAKADVIPEMTSQQIFNIVATHLFAQGKKSEDHSKRCVYRGANGTKCAVGVLIPDEVYQSKWDQNSFSVDSIFYLKRDDMQPLAPHRDLLVGLQRIHDNYINWHASQTMHMALSMVAKEFGLLTNSIRKLKFADR